MSYKIAQKIIAQERKDSIYTLESETFPTDIAVSKANYRIQNLLGHDGNKFVEGVTKFIQDHQLEERQQSSNLEIKLKIARRIIICMPLSVASNILTEVFSKAENIAGSAPNLLSRVPSLAQWIRSGFAKAHAPSLVLWRGKDPMPGAGGMHLTLSKGIIVNFPRPNPKNELLMLVLSGQFSAGMATAAHEIFHRGIEDSANPPLPKQALLLTRLQYCVNYLEWILAKNRPQTNGLPNGAQQTIRELFGIGGGGTLTYLGLENLSRDDTGKGILTGLCAVALYALSPRIQNSILIPIHCVLQEALQQKSRTFNKQIIEPGKSETIEQRNSRLAIQTAPDEILAHTLSILLRGSPETDPNAQINLTQTLLTILEKIPFYKERLIAAEMENGIYDIAKKLFGKGGILAPGTIPTASDFAKLNERSEENSIIKAAEFLVFISDAGLIEGSTETTGGITQYIDQITSGHSPLTESSSEISKSPLNKILEHRDAFLQKFQLTDEEFTELAQSARIIAYYGMQRAQIATQTLAIESILSYRVGKFKRQE